jgi:hypothetical protein
MMENGEKAVYEVLGERLKPHYVRKCLLSVYRFMIYYDRESLYQILDYRDTLGEEEKASESYYVFKYMLKLLKEKHPAKLAGLRSQL